MKKGILGFLACVLFLSTAATARADYSVSIGFRTDSHPRQKQHKPLHSYRNYGRYPYGYYYWPSRPRQVYTKTVIVRDQREKTPVSGERVGISDIIVLVKAGVNDDAIIDKISKTRSVFLLTAEETTLLSKEGVSNRIINFMLRTAK
ncbi:MAG: hypothetical protein WC732_03965 [Candidatus Omnitrophota bacterium]